MSNSNATTNNNKAYVFRRIIVERRDMRFISASIRLPAMRVIAFRVGKWKGISYDTSQRYARVCRLYAWKVSASQ